MNEDVSHQRQTFLGVLLAGLGLLFFGLVLILISGGYLTYLIAVVLAMFVWGSLHWLLWGRGLSRAVAGEREEEQLRQRALGRVAAEDDSPPHPAQAGQEQGIKPGPSPRFRRM